MGETDYKRPCPQTRDAAPVLAKRLAELWQSGTNEEEWSAILEREGWCNDDARWFAEMIPSTLFRIAMERGPMPQAWESVDMFLPPGEEEQFDYWVRRELLLIMRRLIPGEDKPLPEPVPLRLTTQRPVPRKSRVIGIIAYTLAVPVPILIVIVLWWMNRPK